MKFLMKKDTTNIVGVSATKELSAEKIPAEEGGTNVQRLAHIPEPTHVELSYRVGLFHP